MSSDTLFYTVYNQQGGVVSENIYDLQFSINTVVRDNSVLVIDEKYNGLDSTGKLVVTLSNRNEVTLAEGQENYGNSAKSQMVTPHRIKTFFYDWSGMNTYLKNSELVKIQ